MRATDRDLEPHHLLSPTIAVTVILYSYFTVNVAPGWFSFFNVDIARLKWNADFP